MAYNWTPSEAQASDADAIASLFALSWSSPFTRLQFGSMNTSTLASALAPRIAQQIAEPHMRFIVGRTDDTQKVVAVAQWSVPADERAFKSGIAESPEDSAERQNFEDEAYYESLPKNSNKDLIMVSTIGLRSLRRQVLQGRTHFYLDNLATHPEYRGRGLAGRLIEWAFVQADKQGALVYLETASDNKAMGLYKKLGFEERGRHTIEDLAKFVKKEELEKSGAGTEHTHVAFVRYPRNRC
ncbi:acyl-CoA N-acyltransferase [Clathrospora elynae]|uniref:Acyl-CoA N-acyltransferase n=1 Tax=Clathrospora elynae TaxID=706981 RepID=A0A6A5SLT5_9PLEO|nr:acyl-CoA N-acyltransferase [Clathrospora elynae]